MSTFRCALCSLCTIVCIPMFFFLIIVFFSPIEPGDYNYRFDVANSSVTDFNYTETTRIDGTNNLHYKYNLSLDVTVRRPDKKYDFKHYDDVQVMAFYKNKRFAMVDLSSFYRGKKLTSTTDLLSLKHSLIGEYVDVLAIDPPPEDYAYAQNISAITEDDHMVVAQLHYSVSPQRNIKWPYKTIFSKKELEYKCDLELIFPLSVGQFSQHTNASSSKIISCRANLLVHSWKYYVYFVLIAGLLFFVICLSVVVFIGYLGSDLHLDHKIHDCEAVKIQG